MAAAVLTPAVDPETGWPVWGQKAAVAELRQAVLTGPRHAWILAGADGAGKFLAARTFAKALCCPNRVPGNASPCNACGVCRRIDRGVFPDVTEFGLRQQIDRDGDKSRNLTLNVATVREVSSSVSFRPTESAWKIAIVSDAETMQETAQEAFLKTLEEPPSYAVILLLVSDLEPILPTIQSRCSIVRFGAVSEAEITRSLVAAGVPEADATAISAVASGSPGWAFRAATDPAMRDLRAQELNDARVIVNASPYDQLVACFRLADEFGKDREGTFRRIGVLQQVWRDRLTDSLGLTGAGMDTRAAREAVRAIRAIDQCLVNLEANVRPRLALESMVTSWQAER